MISRKFILAAASLVAASAYAGSVSLDARAEYVGKTYDKVSASAGGNADGTAANSGAIQVTRAKIDGKGKVNDSVDFRARFNVAPNSESAGYADGVSNRADFLYVSAKLHDMVSLSIGKMGSGMGGLEGQYNGGDIYQLTNAIAGGGGQVTVPLYLSGADVKVQLAEGQSIDVSAMNQSFSSASPESTQTVGSSVTKQTTTLNGIVYNGKFLDNSLSAVVSYHMEDKGNSVKANYIAGGLRYSAASFEVEGDYLSNVKDNGTTKDSTQTNRIKAKYMVDQFNPFVQYEMSTNKVADNKTNDVNVITAALEYKPVKDQGFRYHLAYVNSQLKPASGADTQTTTSVIAGVRVLADFLK